MAGEGAEFVIARLSLEVHDEIRWPGSVTVGTGVESVGNSSLTLSQVVYRDERCVARGETVIVQIDSRSRSARPLTEETRDRLDELRLPPKG